MRFAGFLIHNGEISAAQALAALDRQRSATRPIGRITVMHGLLTERQVLDVLEEQDRSGQHRSFGEIVRRNGWLSRAQLELAARAQRASRPPIGEFLVEIGAITVPVLRQRLDEYHDMRPEREISDA